MSDNIPPRYTLAIHGGAGTILKEDMTPELEEAYLVALRQAIDRKSVV